MNRIIIFLMFICQATLASEKESGLSADFKSEIKSYFDTLTPQDINSIKTYGLSQPMGEYISSITQSDKNIKVTLKGAICSISVHEVSYVCTNKCTFNLKPEYKCTMY